MCIMLIMVAKSFCTQSGVCQGWPLYPFLLDFLIDGIMIVRTLSVPSCHATRRKYEGWRCTPTSTDWKLSTEFTTSGDDRQGCSLSTFLFNFVIDTIMKDSLPASNACGVEMLPWHSLTDIEYADGIDFRGSDAVIMQTSSSNHQRQQHQC
ncbi:hypothetical protein CLF_111665 [Clonorchis sinensis]|uniref:Reverse transcriptase domain-containing protein n=1 Tax=Clonorchis sinensis TaxID=79923 RepID=G7YV72_CLOSI|nr:hypothetical protein CLF_111665 [Clonorchis sinensis]